MVNLEKRLAQIEEVIAQGPFHDDWASLSAYQPPKWYRDAKFGIFIHWGVYSVPAFSNEWYPRGMYIQNSPEYLHHIATYGPQKDFGYKDFIPMFKAENYDPEVWAQLFEEAGAQYVVPVAEHHDGFQMYASELSEWNATQKGPCRDVYGELMEACKRHGLVNCASSHRIEHWFFMGHGKEFDSDIREPLQRGDFYWPAMPERDLQDIHSEPAPSQEYLQDWLCRCCELVDRYRPKLFYFDWWIQHAAAKPYLKKFAAYYYNRAVQWGEAVVINYKHDAFEFGTAVVDVERGQFAQTKPYLWQTDTAVAKNSWCYTKDNSYKSSTQILQDLVDIVSKNGRMLLNIGPRADGTIPEEDRRILCEIGEWLKVNGEAIYGSRLWRKSAEGPTVPQEGQFADAEPKPYTAQDIRFTMNGSCLYATCLNMAQLDRITIRSLAVADASRVANFAGIIRTVEVLGSGRVLHWERNEEGLHIQTTFMETDKPVVFKISID